ncbi:hypothetical protein PHSY_006549 [Pseudozyma hubeiensis SY62]|uniref:Uncharacterized protein n=1 Tax=Pseudozyma hubeiensis (strain SY62) TaxID=1305764 RepID=R9PCK0_PSEHS|nr:hypothetical protein PHSY_006549 [Pseudozyma hubeiensis SY62]GAC98952.1 hypothetical protein PHSY_006549 [Pseudozyma hubeiensis SY62]
MFIPPYLQRWALLNLIRVLTIVSCILFISSIIRTLVINFNHYPPPLSFSTSSSSYYPSTDIPTTFLGVFWSTLHHSSILLVLLTVILSELSLPIPLLNRLFKNTLPFLGPNWGTDFLGVLLILVAGDSLSRGDVGGRFAEISAWVVASLGVANVAVGVAWRAKAKVVRSPMGWKAEVAEKLEKLADAKRDAERVVDGLPLPISSRKGTGKGKVNVDGLKSVIGGVGKKVMEKIEESQEKRNREKKGQEEDVEKTGAPAMSIFTPTLPSAVVASRVTPPPAAAANPATASATITSRHAFSTTTRRTSSSSSSYTTSSTTTFDRDQPTHPPPLLTTTFSSPLSRTWPLSPPPRTTLKTVRFTPSPTPHYPSTTVDSLRAGVETTLPPSPLVVEGSNFHLLAPPPSTSSKSTTSTEYHLLAPPPLNLSQSNDSNGSRVGLIDGERSPSVLASLKAAMLEAQAKASPSKKSLYLGSSKWREEYAALTGATPSDCHGGDEEKVQPHHGSEKEKTEKDGRPYNFL